MRIPGLALMTAAVAIGSVALMFNCQVDGKALILANGRQAPMVCYYTAMAEVAVAGLLFMLGGLMAFTASKESSRHLGILGLALAGVVMLLPTVLIGVCADHDASCNLILRPAMLFLGILVLIVSLVPLLSAGPARPAEA